MKLRVALGDTGHEAGFIETLPRRGYRLIVPVRKDEGRSSETPDRQSRQSLLIGQKVSHYRVLGTRPPSSVLNGKPARLRRSTIPISAIYEVEEGAGQAFIVMELLEGETLRS